MIALLAEPAHTYTGNSKNFSLDGTVGGYYPSGLNKLDEAVDAVLRGQLERLAAQAEKP
jgi:hypothetical protein